MMSALTLNDRIASAEHHESALRPVILPEYAPAAPYRRGPLSMVGAAAVYALVSLLRTLLVLTLILIILSVVVGLAVAAAT
jgi:hypothetical protein